MMKVSIPIAGAVGAALALVPTWVWAQAPSETDRYGYGPHMMSWGGGWYGKHRHSNTLAWYGRAV